MRTCTLSLGFLLLAGCASLPFQHDDGPTQQVASSLSPDQRGGIVQTKVSYAPATLDIGLRLNKISGKLIGDNPQAGLKPMFVAIASPEPEIFHVGLAQVYVTDALIRQCPTDGILAAVIANELGRMVSQREATVSDQVRNPEPLRPIYLPIGGSGNARDADPLFQVEMAKFEQQYPRQPRKLSPPNPQLVARSLLKNSGYETTELDAAEPILQNAARFAVLERQFKGASKPGEWK